MVAACVACLCIVGCDTTPFTPAVILPAEKAAAYQEEFVKSLRSYWGEFKTPHYSFHPDMRIDSKGRDYYLSPDGALQVTQTSLRDYHHRIALAAPGAKESESKTILILQEGDPGSGRGHEIQWAKDSKAVFIHGSGTPAGHPRNLNLALVYLVDTKTLHAVDIKALLAERTEAERRDPKVRAARRLGLR